MAWRPSYALPASMQSVAKAIGPSATISVIHVFGGTRLWIPFPRNLDDAHPLVRFLGGPCALALARDMGGTHVEIPVGRSIISQARDERLFQRWRTGVSISALAGEFGVSRRTAYQIVMRVRAARK